MTNDRREQIDAKRAEMLDSIRDRVDRELNDERYASWRAPARRRLVIAGWLGAVAGMTASAWFDWSLILPVGMLAALGSAFLLRRIV
ncbi:MAG: hypothetical protein AAF081_18830, partial [Actinomycetota bacterium]